MSTFQDVQPEPINRNLVTGIYSSLKIENGSNNIRVLILKPSLGLHGQLKATLRVKPLNESFEYEALSYTWGESTRSRTIQLNHGYKLRITDNLYNALRRLRRNESTRTLWIDAVCINQDDLDERASQVAIMGKIYQAATRVLVWLGEYKNASLLNKWKMRLPQENWMGTIHSRNRIFAAALADGLSNAEPRWIDRAWVVQEFALSRKATFHIGPFSVDVDTFHGPEDVPEDQRFYLRFYQRYGEDINMTEFWDHIKDMRLLRSQAQKHTLDLFTAHLWSNRTQCQNRHDKLYSLLGLICPEEVRIIHPNYGDTLSRAFAKAAFASIIAHQNFDIMALIEFGLRRDGDLPSWVPDFSAKLTDPLDLRQSMDKFYAQLPRLVNEIGAPAQLSTDSALLTARGIVLGRVVSSVSLISPDGSLADVPDCVWRNVLRQYQITPTSGVRDSLVSFTQDNWSDTLRAFHVWSGTDGEVKRTLFGAPRATDLVGAGLLYTFHAGRGAYIFVSTSCHVGIAAQDLKEGDRIVLLSGAKLPVIIRPIDTTSTFHGLAFIPGLTKECVNDGLPLEEFVLY